MLERSQASELAQNAPKERDFKIFLASGGAAQAAGAMVTQNPEPPWLALTVTRALHVRACVRACVCVHDV